MAAKPASGKKTPQQLRLEFGPILLFDEQEMPALAKEAEALYNKLSETGQTPSPLFEKLIEVLKREAIVINHPDVDGRYCCSECGKR